MSGSFFKKSELCLAMLLVQLFSTGSQILSRLILNRGIFVFALMAYRNITAAIFVAPLVFLYEREYAKKLNLKIFMWLFLSSLTGLTGAMGLYYYGLRDTNASFSMNFLNLIPIVTFIFSIFLRMENLGLRTRAGKTKILGVTLCVGGALITSLYKGFGFHIGGHLITNHVVVAITTVASHQPHWTRGTLLLVASCISYGLWFIVQVKLLKLFPSKYFVIMLTCIIACIQSTVVGLCLDHHTSAWKLGWNIQLLTILYSGAVATAATFCFITWAISVRGPTYPSMFNPIGLVFVVVAEAILFGEEIKIGNLVGIVVIIGGLYCFLWGKMEENKSHLTPSISIATESVKVSLDIEQGM